MEEKNIFFEIRAKYDETAYRALGEATWDLFWRKRMQIRTFPIFGGMILLVAFSLLTNFKIYGPIGKGLHFLGIVFFILSFWLLSFFGRKKLARKTCKLAKDRGALPLDVIFQFEKNRIVSRTGTIKSSVRYDRATGYFQRKEWDFLFFGTEAFLWKEKDVENPEEFNLFLIEKTELEKKIL